MDRRPAPRIILVHACRAAHTREMHGSSESTKNCSKAALVHSADSESILEFFVFSLFSRRNRNQLTERSRLTSRTTYLRACKVELKSGMRRENLSLTRWWCRSCAAHFHRHGIAAEAEAAGRWYTGCCRLNSVLYLARLSVGGAVGCWIWLSHQCVWNFGSVV